MEFFKFSTENKCNPTVVLNKNKGISKKLYSSNIRFGTILWKQGDTTCETIVCLRYNKLII